jgi:hypothetical protein
VAGVRKIASKSVPPKIKMASKSVPKKGNVPPTKSTKAASKKPAPPAKKQKPAVKASKPSPRAGSDPVIWEGKPDEKLEGGWPSGWIKRIYERQEGASKGTKDRYWYTPIQKYKLRSMVEVKKFLKALADHDGDEIMAKKKFKSYSL